MAVKNLGRVVGKSAYEIWLEQGNTGTEQEFLDSLKGKNYVLTGTDKEEIAETVYEQYSKDDINSLSEKVDGLQDRFSENANVLKEEYIPIDYIKKECNKRGYIYVDKNGNGNYTTVTEAVKNAENGATIIVNSGNYTNEMVECWGKEIHIIGVSKETCIISNDTATYSTPPIEIGRGSLENLTVIAEFGTGVSNDSNKWLAYAVHSEDSNLKNGTLTIRDCTLISELNAAFGLVMYGGCTVNLENTNLIGRNGTGNRSLFFHDAASVAYAGEQNININNCILESDSSSQHTFRLEDQCTEGSTINLTMINTLIFNKKGTNVRVGTSNKGGGTYEGWRGLKNTTLTAKSFGNNISAFNDASNTSNQTHSVSNEGLDTF